MTTNNTPDNFPVFIKRQEAARFLALYEIYKKTLGLQGCVVECGVFRGFSLMSLANFADVLEPLLFKKRIIGFDTFTGFPSLTEKDKNTFNFDEQVEGYMAAGEGALEQLEKSINDFEANRLLRHRNKIELVQGDAMKTIPTFLDNNPDLIVSLLYLDFDLFEPTLQAIKAFLPRMPKGSVIAFDELNDPRWPGETEALLQSGLIRNREVNCFSFDPHISWLVV
jgi:hypothetical protein